eukprot:4296066-Alexandrium_andersonii.AAC.1
MEAHWGPLRAPHWAPNYGRERSDHGAPSCYANASSPKYGALWGATLRGPCEPLRRGYALAHGANRPQ